MTNRLHNDFQFLDVGRRDPAKKELVARQQQFVEIYQPMGQRQAAAGRGCMEDGLPRLDRSQVRLHLTPPPYRMCRCPAPGEVHPAAHHRQACRSKRAHR